MHDVAVVGAGPAGSYAAYRCASFGLDTVLLEKATLPRIKACGGAVDSDVVSYLGKEVMDVVERESTSNHIFFNYKRIQVLERRKLLVRRENFDHFITELASSAGCRVEDSQKVSSVSVGKDCARIETSGGTHKSKVVIGADGAYSVVGSSVGLTHDRDRHYAAFRSQIDIPDSEIDTMLDIGDETHHNSYFFSGLLGFAWLIPNRNSLNVGIGAIKRKSVNLRGKFNDFLKKLGLEENPPVIGHLIPYQPLDKLYSERVILVGDAGGFVNPWNGCGIDFGIESSEKAAMTCKRAVERNDFSEASMSKFQNSLSPLLRNLRFRARIVGILDDLTPEDFEIPSIGETFVKHLSKTA